MNILILFPVLVATHTSVEVEEKKWILRWKEEIMWRFLHLFWPPLFGCSCKCWFKLNRWTCVGVPPSPFSVHRQHQQHLFGQDISLYGRRIGEFGDQKKTHTKKLFFYLRPKMNACSAVWEVQQNIQNRDEGGKKCNMQEWKCCETQFIEEIWAGDDDELYIIRAHEIAKKAWKYRDESTLRRLKKKKRI